MKLEKEHRMNIVQLSVPKTEKVIVIKLHFVQ